MDFLKSRINVDNLQRILDCFVELTGIRVAYFGGASESIAGKSKGICRFCSEIRRFPDFNEGCIASDKAAFSEAEKRRSLYLYECHLGLWEAVVPLFIRGKAAGCLMLGQVRIEEDANRQFGFIEDRLRISGISSDSLKTIKEAFFEMPPFSREKIEAAAKMLEMITHYVAESEIIQIHYMETVEKARHYMEANFTQKLSTSKIARIAGLNPSYLSFLFHKETGVTITGYLEKLRMEFAKAQLLDTSLSIKEIAAKTGYEDQNYFSRVFKRHNGCSPAEYAKSAKHFLGDGL